MLDIKKFLADNSQKLPAVFQFAKFSNEKIDVHKSTVIKKITDKRLKGTITISPFHKDITRHL